MKDGGYALKNYEKYRRLKTLENGHITINSKADIRRYKMNIGTIIEAPMLTVKFKRKRVNFQTNPFKNNKFINIYFLTLIFCR